MTFQYLQIFATFNIYFHAGWRIWYRVMCYIIPRDLENQIYTPSTTTQSCHNKDKKHHTLALHYKDNLQTVMLVLCVLGTAGAAVKSGQNNFYLASPLHILFVIPLIVLTRSLTFATQRKFTLYVTMHIRSGS